MEGRGWRDAAKLVGVTMLVVQSCACAHLERAPAEPPRTEADAKLKIVTMAEWGGTPADEAIAVRHAVTRITLHHQGEAFPPGKDAGQYLRDLQSWSRSTKKWVDVPYHYVVDLDGRVYEGRRIDYAGDTNTQYDPTGHALIEVVGNFEEVEPSQGQLDAVVAVMAMLAVKYDVPIESIQGHRDFSSETVCPGKSLYRFLENGYFREAVRRRLRAITRIDR